MKSKLIEMNECFPQTELWTDSFHVEHHEYGLTQNITGVTTSPTWVSRMLLNEPAEEHKAVIKALCKQHPDYNEREIAWAWTLTMGKQRSQIMIPLWKEGNVKKGRFSIQTSIYDYNNTERMVKMAQEVDACNENMQVKIPSTKAGIQAMEEATYLGISVMATLCFSVDQAIAVAKAIQRGMDRRSEEGLSNEKLNPVCAVLLGMQDDWLKSYSEANDIVVHPDAFNWGGVAICKKIYHIFKERGYQTRILTAYYRHQLHYSEFIGGDMIMTIPTKWQKRFANCDIEIKDYMSIPVVEDKLKQLNKLKPFVQAYNEGSLTLDDFNTFPPVILTIRYFSEEYDKAVKKIRDYMLEKPI
ncbi:MAG: transaldolase [Erysipelotrichia bacterium]|nr:transaldolase [Erysipelotrichia bacterium]